VSRPELTYSVVTPARDEVTRLTGLAACLCSQTIRPRHWVIADNGSSDGTGDLVRELAVKERWISRVDAPVSAVGPIRGGPVVAAFMAGLEALPHPVDVVVKLDADLTFEAEYFERLLRAFEADPQLGIASGVCHELRDGRWRPLHGTRSHVWGAARAYRTVCLRAIMPLEERQGWDEIDALKAVVRGWRVGTIDDLPFRHHRAEGARDGALRRWRDQGETAHYMGYRPSYLVVRAAYQARRDPRALALLAGYAVAAAHRARRWDDASAREYLRREQRLRKLPVRLREARGGA
jgi:glycosyltransferase involved in cell wall biosynthesis